MALIVFPGRGKQINGQSNEEIVSLEKLRIELEIRYLKAVRSSPRRQEKFGYEGIINFKVSS